MRWIKKEIDEDGKTGWAVYYDETGKGNQEEWIHRDTYETRDEAVAACRIFDWEECE